MKENPKATRKTNIISSNIEAKPKMIKRVLIKKKDMDTIYYEVHGNLYLNITNRCTANCTFCIRNFSDGVCGYNLWLSKEPSIEEIIGALKTLDLTRYREIVFTGFGEPTLRLDLVLDVIRWIKKEVGGMQVRLDTNGHAALVYPERNVISELKDAGLDAVSVSLNAESEEPYNKLCRPAYKNAYQTVLAFIKDAKKAGFRTRATVVKIPEIDVEKCRELAKALGVELYARKF